MTKRSQLLLILALAFACAATPASAQLTFTFDQNGNDWLNNNVIPNQGILRLDPVANDGVLYLSFELPLNVGAVDVGVMAGPHDSTLVNGLRFENINGTSWMFYYSLDKGASLADTGLPSNFSPGVTTNQEGNQFTYDDAGNAYVGLSAVSEPASLVLLGTGLIGAAGLARRHTSAR